MKPGRNPLMHLFALTLAVVTAFSATACGGSETNQSPATGTVVTPAQTTTRGAQPTKGPAVTALNPSLETALSCRVPAVSRTASGGGLLESVPIDNRVYPAAVCNDGTPGILSFRPFEGEQNRNKWVVMLAGGGSCSTGQDCADRWCGVGTNFDADNMSTANGGAGATGDGLLKRTAENPFGNWNQVVIRYCSSDTWTGAAFNTTLTAKDPKTGKDVTYQTHFAGSAIFLAAVSMLRSENGEKFTYTRAGSTAQLPDLDEATEVLFGGGSAGGGGTVYNLDRFASMLQGGANKPVVRGFIDAIVGPPRSEMTYQSSTYCTAYKLCDYQSAQMAQTKLLQDSWKNWTDQSCLDWHAKNSPGTEWQCMDVDHLLEHHVTTPYFIRQNLGDVLRSDSDISAGLAGADRKPFTKTTWGSTLAAWLTKLPTSLRAGHEKSAVTTSPGVFAPACVKHYTLFDGEATYGDTITVNGTSYNVIKALSNWWADKTPSVLVSSGAGSDRCLGDR